MLSSDLSTEQVLRAEIQHYLRTKAGQTIRLASVENARTLSPKIWEALLETYLEECTHQKSGPTHLELIRRLLIMGGLSEEDLSRALPTAGNAAAMALYKEISERGAGCHILGAGAVEHYYSRLSPSIYRAYTESYGMTPEQVETYRIHGPMDANHADRAFDVLEEAIALHGWSAIEQSVRDAFVATSLHYDGMLQAAIGQICYWDGTRI